MSCRSCHEPYIPSRRITFRGRIPRSRSFLLCDSAPTRGTMKQDDPVTAARARAESVHRRIASPESAPPRSYIAKPEGEMPR